MISVNQCKNWPGFFTRGGGQPRAELVQKSWPLQHKRRLKLRDQVLSDIDEVDDELAEVVSE
jgi:hypothetical protein